MDYFYLLNASLSGHLSLLLLLHVCHRPIADRRVSCIIFMMLLFIADCIGFCLIILSSLEKQSTKLMQASIREYSHQNVFKRCVSPTA